MPSTGRAVSGRVMASRGRMRSGPERASASVTAGCFSQMRATGASGILSTILDPGVVPSETTILSAVEVWPAVTRIRPMDAGRGCAATKRSQAGSTASGTSSPIVRPVPGTRPTRTSASAQKRLRMTWRANYPESARKSRDARPRLRRHSRTAIMRHGQTDRDLRHHAAGRQQAALCGALQRRPHGARAVSSRGSAST